MVHHLPMMDVYQALAEPTRREIVAMLAGKGQLSASSISDHFSVSAPAISQHLKVLREAELVVMEKRAQKHIYTINTRTLHQVEDWARKMRVVWEERFERLDTLLKTGETKINTKKG